MTSSDSLQSEIFSKVAEIKCPQCEKLQFEPSDDVLSGKYNSSLFGSKSDCCSRVCEFDTSPAQLQMKVCAQSTC